MRRPSRDPCPTSARPTRPEPSTRPSRRARSSRPPLRIVVGLLAATALGAPALGTLVSATAATTQAPATVPATTGGDSRRVLVDRGRALFSSSCASCHGDLAEGVPHRGPDLRDAGSAAVDFYVSTGRMPLERPGIEPSRGTPQFGRHDTDALIAFVDSVSSGDGPVVPAVVPGRGDVALGRRLFADSCSGCHQIMARGGAAPGFVAPSLREATPTQIGEAVRVGPYLMPRFSQARLDDHDVDSIARFVTTVARDAPDRGGWGIGNVGPVPEGLVAILLGGGSLLLVARVIGERHR